ncbi:MAG: hypothetical protein KOO62_04775 [candidate division Zixibacteria bacterium]|nr:hypothetical protein [candidate division Zixibacteria bacterium]
MKNSLTLLVALIGLYLALSLILHVVYGPSFGFLAGEDCWIPDGDGGWMAHGIPDSIAPDSPSMNVPLLLRYLPIYVPGLILAMFMFTPLRRFIESKPDEAKVASVKSEDDPISPE